MSAATRLQAHLDMLMLDMAYLRRATRQRMGGHGIPGQLRRYIYRDYGNVCVKCGETFSVDELELGHLIPAALITPGERAGYRGGYVPGNIGLWCEQCNDSQGEAMVRASDLARPDCVPLAWPALSWRKPIA